jgi:hypothetical protein
MLFVFDRSSFCVDGAGRGGSALLLEELVVCFSPLEGSAAIVVPLACDFSCLGLVPLTKRRPKFRKEDSTDEPFRDGLGSVRSSVSLRIRESSLQRVLELTIVWRLT